MRPRLLWILVVGAALAAVAVGVFALERTGVIGSGGSPTPPAREHLGDSVVDEDVFREDPKTDSHNSADDNEPDENERGRGPAANENEPDENEGGRGPSANEKEPDENDRGD
jgi:hypothetical protein